MKTGIKLILEERQRQINEKGYDTHYDGRHDSHELAFAAATYALPDIKTSDFKRTHLWPFEPIRWRPTPKDRIRELAKAGALIAAEIDRLQASQPHKQETNLSTEEKAKEL